MTDQEFIDQQWDEHGDYTEPGEQRRHFEQALRDALAYAREQFNTVCDKAADLSQPSASEGDWSEDFIHENGHYMKQCVKCDRYFSGYKRRVICKACCPAALSQPSAQEGK